MQPKEAEYTIYRTWYSKYVIRFNTRGEQQGK